MVKKKPDDSGTKGKEAAHEPGTAKQQEKPQNAPGSQQFLTLQKQQAPMQQPPQQQVPWQQHQPQQAQWQPPQQQAPWQQPPQYQGQPPPDYYPPPPHYNQAGPYSQNSNDNDKEKKGESEKQQQKNMPYSPYPPPYSNPGSNQMPYSQNQSSPNAPGYPTPHNEPQYSYPGTSQMPQPQNQRAPNAPGHPSPLPYRQVVNVESPKKKTSPYVSRAEKQQNSEEPLRGYSGFADKEVRRVFVRKVYLILMVQLLFTLAVICLFVFEPNTKEFVHRNYFIQFIALAVFIGTFMGLACCGDLRRKYPTNLILLSIFTVAASVMMGAMSSYHDTNSVLIAVAICAAVCFCVTLFSFHTKFDFTTCGSMLCILLLILVLFGIIAIFVREKIMTMIYAALGAIVFIMYLAYDTQMLMGGKNVEISPEEYILAAIQLYIDVIYIFMFILMLMGLTND